MRIVRGISIATSVVLFASTVPALAVGRVADRYYVTQFSTLGVNDGAYGINDLGQVTGGGTAGAPFLWTPTTPNSVDGASVRINLPVINPSGPFGPTRYVQGAGWDVNARGQVAGALGSDVGAFLWTPTTPNGSTGDSVRLTSASATVATGFRLNDYGQVTLDENNVAKLFTPHDAERLDGATRLVRARAGADGRQRARRCRRRRARRQRLPLPPHRRPRHGRHDRRAQRCRLGDQQHRLGRHADSGAARERRREPGRRRHVRAGCPRRTRRRH